MSRREPLDVPAALRFFRALRTNNDREWFECNRGVYDEQIKVQFEEFVTGLLIAGAAFDERLALIEPRRCIFRIYRDVRFSRDKTPYKTRLSAFLSPRGWRGTTPGFYIGIEPGGASLVAAGIYMPEKPVLADVRRRLADGDPAFDRLLRAKRMAPYLPLDTDPLVRMPAGFDRDHPRGELLRARRYMVRRLFSDAELAAGAFDLYRGAMRDTAPLVRWLDASLNADLPDGFESFDA